MIVLSARQVLQTSSVAIFISEGTPVYILSLTYIVNKKIIKNTNEFSGKQDNYFLLFWSNVHILIQFERNVVCQIRKQSAVFNIRSKQQYLQFTVSRKSFHTGCSNLTSMFLYVVIFQQMTYLFAVKTSPNMIGLSGKEIIIKKQLNLFSKVPDVVFCTTFDCVTADWLVY